MNAMLTLLACLVTSTPAIAGEWAVGGGYFGETLTHPGALGVAEYRPDSRGAQPLVAMDIGLFWHPRAALAPFVDLRGGWRVESAGHYSADLTAGLGYVHSFIAAETVNFTNTGRPALMPLVDLGFFGWTFDPLDEHSMRLASSLRLFWQYPVNTHAVLHPALTLTLTRPL